MRSDVAFKIGWWSLWHAHRVCISYRLEAYATLIAVQSRGFSGGELATESDAVPE
jgi:hypothetical protein